MAKRRAILECTGVSLVPRSNPGHPVGLRSSHGPIQRGRARGSEAGEGRRSASARNGKGGAG
jgi:hypothetical protein